MSISFLSVFRNIMKTTITWRIFDDKSVQFVNGFDETMITASLTTLTDNCLFAIHS